MKWSFVWSLRMDTATGEWSSSDLSGLWWHQCPSDFCKHFLSKHWLFRATLVSVTLVMGLSVDAVAAVFALARAWVWTCCSVPVQILWHSHNEARYRVPGFPGSRYEALIRPYHHLSPARDLTHWSLRLLVVVQALRVFWALLLRLVPGCGHFGSIRPEIPKNNWDFLQLRWPRPAHHWHLWMWRPIPGTYAWG